MTSTSRKSLSFLGLAVLGGAGIYAWKAQSPSPPSPVANSAPTTQQPASNHPAIPSRFAFLSDSSQPWQLRIELLRKALSSECGEREIRDLYDHLTKGAPQGELPEHGYVIANEVMEQLRRHDSDPKRFSSSLLHVLQDSRQPLVIRDYAVQHLATWLNPRSPQATEDNPSRSSASPTPEIAAQVLQSLVAATTDPELATTTIPGTTLMMLVNLVRNPGSVDCSQAIATLKPWLSRALEDGSTLDTPIRVSAVHAAGMLAPKDFRPSIRKIAYAENGQSSLRLPSIAVLGQCGEAEDVGKLKNVASTNPDLSYAAQEACQVLTARLAAGGPK